MASSMVAVPKSCSEAATTCSAPPELSLALEATERMVSLTAAAAATS